jgi:hypothetical protein
MNLNTIQLKQILNRPVSEEVRWPTTITQYEVFVRYDKVIHGYTPKHPAPAVFKDGMQ